MPPVTCRFDSPRTTDALDTAVERGRPSRSFGRIPVTVQRGLAVIALAALCACHSGGRQRARSGPIVRDSNGVRLVVNPTESAATGCVTLASRPRTVIGGGASAGTRAPPLYRVRGGTVLRDGSIVLLNAGTRQMLVFSAEGAFRRAIGREGDGPGEFRSPAWLGRGNGDTTFVWDDRLLRLSTFDASGDFLASRQVDDVGADPQTPVLRGRFADGSFLSAPPALVFIGSQTGVVRFAERYRRYDPATGQTNPLAVGQSLQTVVGDGPVYSLPFGRSDIATAGPNALLIGDTGVPQVRYFTLDGHLRKIVRWSGNPVPVTAADRRAFVRRAPAGALPPVPAPRLRFAATRPFFSDIVIDRLGWTWVEGFAARWEPLADWLVFDSLGLLRCRVEFPVRIRVLEIGADYLLGVERDESDEDVVAVFDLER